MASQAARLREARERGRELGWSEEKVNSIFTQLEEYRERERRETRLRDLNGLLLKEVSSLKSLLTEARGEVEEARKELDGEKKTLLEERGKVRSWVRETREFVPVSPEPTPEPEERKGSGGGVKRGVRVEEGEGKRRCVGEEFGGNGFDPESWRGNWNPVAVKVNGVAWEDGIGGVLAGLWEAGVVSCEGSRWLVDEQVREERKRRGARSSTVLAMVCGAKAGQELSRSGLWVGGRWCSVKRFVAVPPKKKEGVWSRVRKALYDGAVEDVEARNRVWEVLAGMELQLKGLKEGVQQPGRSFGNLVGEVRGEVRKLGVRMEGMMMARDQDLMEEAERRGKRAAGVGGGEDFNMGEDSDEAEWMAELAKKFSMELLWEKGPAGSASGSGWRKGKGKGMGR
ncbi:hypothetical protein HOY82DRAFT_544135 [Tuber indicum]|nr:hypothetical protein HOY82DRAFT_544135 [Tuber indicum]